MIQMQQQTDNSDDENASVISNLKVGVEASTQPTQPDE